MVETYLASWKTESMNTLYRILDRLSLSKSFTTTPKLQLSKNHHVVRSYERYHLATVAGQRMAWCWPVN